MGSLKSFTEAEVVFIRREFERHSPLRYVSINNFLEESRLRALSEEFPGLEWPMWRSLGDSYQKNKLTCDELTCFPNGLRELIIELNSPPFLQFLEKVTGINKLIPDPYLKGGGLHLSTHGGVLAPHTDFHIYDQLDLFRRINVLLYLNPDWIEGDGGSLRLWDKKNKSESEVVVEPIGGRLFIFATNDRSVHGFTDPIRIGIQRKSIALYYYTAAEEKNFAGDATTHWYEHDRVKIRQYPRELLFRLLHQISRAFSLLAHLANPRQGRQWWKTRQQNQVHRDLKE